MEKFSVVMSFNYCKEKFFEFRKSKNLFSMNRKNDFNFRYILHTRGNTNGTSMFLEEELH